MEIVYTISKERYLNLLNGYTYVVQDERKRQRRITHTGLGSREKVIEHLNVTEGLLGTIVGLRIEN